MVDFALFLKLSYRKRSRAYTEVHVLEESPLKEIQAGKKINLLCSTVVSLRQQGFVLYLQNGGRFTVTTLIVAAFCLQERIFLVEVLAGPQG